MERRRAWPLTTTDRQRIPPRRRGVLRELGRASGRANERASGSGNGHVRGRGRRGLAVIEAENCPRNGGDEDGDEDWDGSEPESEDEDGSEDADEIEIDDTAGLTLQVGSSVGGRPARAHQADLGRPWLRGRIRTVAAAAAPFESAGKRAAGATPPNSHRAVQAVGATLCRPRLRYCEHWHSCLRSAASVMTRAMAAASAFASVAGVGAVGVGPSHRRFGSAPVPGLPDPKIAAAVAVCCHLVLCLILCLPLQLLLLLPVLHFHPASARGRPAQY